MLNFPVYSSLLPSTDTCHMHRDQVDPCCAEETSKHPLTAAGLMPAPLSNTEEPYKKGTVKKTVPFSC